MKELIIDATIENVAQVTEFIDIELEAIECSMKAQMQIDVVIDEIFSNIANYAYGSEIGQAVVRFELADPAEKLVELSFIDSGIEYNPLDKEDPDITLSAEERSIGGLGILMVKKMMDQVSYRYEDGQNILTLQKKCL